VWRAAGQHGGTVATVELPGSEFALGATFRRLDGITVEIERVVAHEADRVLPFVWVRSDTYNQDDVATALTIDPSVAEFDLIADLDGEWLYRVEWIEMISTLVRSLSRDHGPIMTALGHGGTWSLRLLVTDRDALSEEQLRDCADHDVSFEITRSYELDAGHGGQFGLSEKQWTVLVAAFEHGYYEIPRAIAAQDLAEELNTSHQALSERLRRAHENLVGNTVMIG